MKIKPEIYANTLLEIGKLDKTTAKRFWLRLQRNKQYRDLPLILEKLDECFATDNNAFLVKIFSSQIIDEQTKTEISKKLQEKYKKEIIAKFIIKPNITGITIQTNSEIWDLSLEGKVAKLKREWSKANG